MDHLRLAEINKRNARTARAMGNREMEQAYTGLANYHENQYAREYAEAAAADHFTMQAEEAAYEEHNDDQFGIAA